MTAREIIAYFEEISHKKSKYRIEYCIQTSTISSIDSFGRVINSYQMVNYEDIHKKAIRENTKISLLRVIRAMDTREPSDSIPENRLPEEINLYIS